ncbi:ArsA family ATPase [Streptomyces solicathayae]|uniref:ArsA-related P-loop ATPase n=1 Tax=Streptomyces solicathayae TaxID=3081768 RepID=A0ABZ0M181_9ACTN|nr:ArsA-related P-loop ATPase [Streptomyces sp. HUAS YS2]WOX24838.1 ArsA-related P-loop ATPase [Streptomyces sp. HUAS YS2]
MRIILVTGPGGSGRTTVAAATALAAARAGRRVLLVSAEADAVLGEGADGVPGPALLRPDPAADFRREFLALQSRSAAALDLLGAVPFEDAELTELPGSTQFALLRALRTAAAGDHDLVVADLPPLPEAVALLALPEQLRRYLRRILPPERQAARALRPMLAQLAGVPMPAQWLYGTAARWEAELAAVQAVVDAPSTSVRVVAEPGPAADDALRTARLGLALHGRTVDRVVANRLLPADSPDPWLAGLAAQQRTHLESLRAAYGSVHEVPHLGRAPRGPEDLALLAPGEGTDAPDPGLVPAPRAAIEDPAEPGGVFTWRLPVPGAAKRDISLVRRGDELLLGVGPFRRVLPLAPVLRRCTVSGAALVDGFLRIRFTPDPGLWPKDAVPSERTP